MQRTTWWSLVGVFCLFGVVACSENPSELKQLGDGRRALVVTPTETLDQSIGEILALFPNGLQTAATSRWGNIKRKYAAGLSDPSRMTVAKQMLFELSDWLNQKTPEMGAPPNNETKAGAAARAILYMSMYVYSGPETNPPPFTPSADVVVGLVTPGAPATIVTPTKHAGVQLEAGSVAENTIVVITQNPTPYPANCSGPLQTRLCQYPQFYTFDEFPHKRLLKGAKFNVCHVNSGDARRPLADHDRFRLAHAKPADPADYTPGSTIRDQNGENIEILPLVAQTFSTCVGNFYASNSTAGGVLGILSRFARGAHDFVSPRTAYAIDLGLGGFSVDMSPFNDVDPLGLPDLAVQSLSTAPTTASPGAHVTLSYSVKNIGTATAASVPANIFLTPPTGVEGQPPVGQQIGLITIPSLPPQATDTRIDVDVTIPQPLTPGAYHVSLVLGNDPVFPDTNATNNSASAVLSISLGIINLGVLPGDDGSVGIAINQAGHAVGYDQVGLSFRPFIWMNGQMTSLGSLGGTSGGAYAINNSDEVVGTSQTSAGENRAFRWKNGTMTNLGTLPGTISSTAFGINSFGQIIGVSVDAETGYWRGWTWQNGVMTELGLPPGARSTYPYAINDAGQIAGWSDGEAGTAWVWQNGTMTVLSTLGGESFAYGIDGNGVVVGTSTTKAGDQHAVRWANGAITDLGVLPGDVNSQANGISANGRIVGLSYHLAELHAFLWQSGHMINLGTLGGSSGEALGINEVGQIVGQSTTADGKLRATIWQAPPFE